MKPILLAALLAIAQSVSAAPASEDTVETLLVLTKTDRMLDSMLANLAPVVRQSVAQAVAGKTVTPEQQRFLDAASTKFIDIMREEMSWSKMKPQFVHLYKESFNQEEIDGLTAFYRSPIGQTLVNKMPSVMQKAAAMGQQMSRDFGPKIQAAVDQALKEANISK